MKDHGDAPRHILIATDALRSIDWCLKKQEAAVCGLFLLGGRYFIGGDAG
jgi:hypothetical protein